MIIFAKRNIIISIRSFLPTERHNVKTDCIYHPHCILVFWSKKGSKRAEKLPKMTKVQSLRWTHPSTKWYSVHLYTFVSPCELRSAHLHSAHGGKHIHCVHWSVLVPETALPPFPTISCALWLSAYCAAALVHSLFYYLCGNPTRHLLACPWTRVKWWGLQQCQNNL